MNKPIISLIQMDIKTAEVEDNFSKAAKLIEIAKGRCSNFIVIPEMWSTGFAYDDLLVISKQYFRETIDFLTYHARQANAYIIGGSIPEIENESRGTKFCASTIYNTCFIANPHGDIIGSYRKIHSFGPFEEDKYFSQGKIASPIETEFGKIGVLICYDIRFPEISRKLSLDDINILFVPAQFPHPRQEHWEVLLRARAIENAIFVAGCNRIGKDSKNEYFGGSMTIDPFGEILEKGNAREGVITAQIDLDKIKEARERIPVYKDRCPEAYK